MVHRLLVGLNGRQKHMKVIYRSVYVLGFSRSHVGYK